jgi:hypothetical protein
VAQVDVHGRGGDVNQTIKINGLNKDSLFSGDDIKKLIDAQYNYEHPHLRVNTKYVAINHFAGVLSIFGLVVFCVGLFIGLAS